MFVAMLIALVTITQTNTTAAEPLPQIKDIRFALVDYWVRISSSGYGLHDYAVRNVICLPIPLSKESEELQKGNDPFHFTDPAKSQARCSYDFAPLPVRKVRNRSALAFKKMRKPLTAKQLRHIKENQ